MRGVFSSSHASLTTYSYRISSRQMGGCRSAKTHLKPHKFNSFPWPIESAPDGRWILIECLKSHRAWTRSDELTSLEIYNSVWPHDAVTIDAVHSFRDSAQDYVDYLVRDDGVVLGSGVGAIFGYRADRVISLITVPAAHRKRGAGTALYEAISSMGQRATGHASWRCQSPTTTPESLSFAQHRGFVEERREVRLVLKPRRPLAVAGQASGRDRNRHLGAAAGARTRDVRGGHRSSTRHPGLRRRCRRTVRGMDGAPTCSGPPTLPRRRSSPSPTRRSSASQSCR